MKAYSYDFFKKILERDLKIFQSLKKVSNPIDNPFLISQKMTVNNFLKKGFIIENQTNSYFKVTCKNSRNYAIVDRNDSNFRKIVIHIFDDENNLPNTIQFYFTWSHTHKNNFFVVQKAQWNNGIIIESNKTKNKICIYKNNLEDSKNIYSNYKENVLKQHFYNLEKINSMLLSIETTYSNQLPKSYLFINEGHLGAINWLNKTTKFRKEWWKPSAVFINKKGKMTSSENKIYDKYITKSIQYFKNQVLHSSKPFFSKEELFLFQMNYQAFFDTMENLVSKNKIDVFPNLENIKVPENS